MSSSWRFLEAGVDKIMNSLRDGMNLKAYMSLYTAIHNFCTAQKAVGTNSPLNATHRGGTSNREMRQVIAVVADIT